jgi:hypothetical protein
MNHERSKSPLYCREEMHPPVSRRPRESGGPEPAPGLNRGQVTEIPGFPLSRERRDERCEVHLDNSFTAAFAGVTCTEE